MIRRICFLPDVLVLILIVSTGCGQIAVDPKLATETIAPSKTNTDIPPSITATEMIYRTSGGVQLGANLDCPNRSAFGIIVENTPYRGSVIDSFPFQFRWYYQPLVSPPNDWSSECVPTSFTMYLSKGPEYNKTITVPINSLIIDDIVNFLLYQFQFSGDLDPVSVYRWIVVGHADNINIDEDQLTLFTQHEMWADNVWEHPHGQFQTGPRCTTNTIQPVSLFYPPNNTILDTDSPIFQWKSTDCSANAFRVAFSRDNEFITIERGWVTSSLEFVMYPNVLEPCVQYYWKVDSGPYSMDYHLQMGDWATSSPVNAFIIRSSECPNAVIELSTRTPTATYFAPTIVWPTATQKPATRTPQPTEVVCENIDDAETCMSFSKCQWIPNLSGPPGQGDCVTK